MDPRERLRRYLEQRRELGETELVLDGMSVEQVMRIIGAAAPEEATVSRRRRGDVPDRSDDWRSVLRAAGAADDVAAEEVDRARARAPRRGDAPTAPPGMEESPAPGAATPEAAEGAEPPRPSAAPGKAAPRAEPAVDAPAGLSVGQASQELFAGPLASAASLDDIVRMVAGCKACPLYSTAISHVPGEGSPTAELMCVGEAPGEQEDRTGRPFVGASGQLLTKILAAIRLSREEVYIANVLKHRPPGNRNPRPEEVEACSPYLVRQIELIRPKVIICFGTFAAQTLLNTKLAIGKLRGQVHRYYGVPLVVTYHPAALLRNPAWKRPTWEDVQLARRILDSGRAAGA